MQLEIALQLDSPPEAQAARRELKLLAMKAALEGRPSAAPKPAIDALFATLLGRVALDTRERERLRAVVDALRKRGPAGAA